MQKPTKVAILQNNFPLEQNTSEQIELWVEKEDARLGSSDRSPQTGLGESIPVQAGQP